MNKDLENIGRTWGEAKLMASNKTRWKALVEALFLLRGQEDQVKSSQSMVELSSGLPQGYDNICTYLESCLTPKIIFAFLFQ